MGEWSGSRINLWGQRLAGLVVLLAIQATPGQAENRAVSYAQVKVEGMTVHRLTVDLRRPEVKISVAVAAGGFPHANESFSSILQRTRPTAAINGTFFDKQTLKPIGDIVIDGQVVHEGRMGTALAIKPDNQASIFRVPWGHSQDWSGYQTVLACGPTLVKDGQIDLQLSAEGFRDPHVLGAGHRSACGLTAEGKLVLVSVTRAIRLEQLARIMRALGCVQAMNLDGGASTAMYYRGKIVVPAGRLLTNVLLIYEDRHRAPVFSNADRLYQNGLRLKRAGQLERALEQLQLAIEADPDHRDAHWTRAWVLAELERTEEAIAAFEKVLALKLDPARDRQARAALERLGGVIPTPTGQGISPSQPTVPSAQRYPSGLNLEVVPLPVAVGWKLECPLTLPVGAEVEVEYPLPKDVSPQEVERVTLLGLTRPAPRAQGHRIALSTRPVAPRQYQVSLRLRLRGGRELPTLEGMLKVLAQPSVRVVAAELVEDEEPWIRVPVEVDSQVQGSLGRLVLLVNGVEAAALTAAPWTFRIPVAALAPGRHLLQVRAELPGGEHVYPPEDLRIDLRLIQWR